MGEITQPNPNFVLRNLETSRAQRSPRSTELRVTSGARKPVELLLRSLNELVAKRHGNPYEAVTVMHETYGKERRKLLQLCREEKDRIVQKGEGRKRATPPRPRPTQLPALEVVGKAFRWSSDYSSPHSPDGDSSAGPMPCGDHGLISSSALGKPSRSTAISGGRGTRCFGLANLNHNNNNNKGGGGGGMVSTGSSHSLGELRHSPAIQTQLEKLTGDVHHRMRVAMSEKDRKIAALMLLKHREEAGRLALRRQEERAREVARGEEAALRAQEENRRRRTLRQNIQRWRQETQALRRSREQRHEELAAARERQAVLQEERWRRSKEELEARHRERSEAARREAQARKRSQERLLQGQEEVERTEREREAQRTLEREQRARRAKATQQRRDKERLSQENHRELLQHILLKQRVEQQAQQEETLARRALEKRLRHSWEAQARASEGRRRELRERGSLREEHIQQARAHAELGRHQQLQHKESLVQLSQSRMDRAAREVSARVGAKAQRTSQRNLERRLCHQQLRERARREEEARREAAESRVTVKERRRSELRAQRERAQEAARRGARASSHVRRSVREQSAQRTFDRMALEAQLSASMAGVTL